MSQDMRRDFKNRAEMLAYLETQFPQAYARDSHVTSTIGGRKQAEKLLKQAKMGKIYEKTRNYLDGAVTRLSPYIRHSVISLAEVRDYALSQVAFQSEAEKFLNELGVRDYWQRVYRQMGDKIWRDLEPYKTGFEADDYAKTLPDDIRRGETGVRFIDDFILELYATGYLHNHARMWLAGYVVHWRMVAWQAGARWFLEHLLDGDPASNNLSWQWVASTFSHKPYFYNLENVNKYTANRYAGNVVANGHEAFDMPYEVLEKQLFPQMGVSQLPQSVKHKRGKR